jgi:hypothetical protein
MSDIIIIGSEAFNKPLFKRAAPGLHGLPSLVLKPAQIQEHLPKPIKDQTRHLILLQTLKNVAQLVIPKSILFKEVGLLGGAGRTEQVPVVDVGRLLAALAVAF